jgi:hypothetical protein
MKCHHCGCDGFNRIVIDTKTDQFLGGICTECEDGLRRGDIDPERLLPSLDLIGLVERRYAIPRLELAMNDSEKGELYFEYESGSDTLYLAEFLGSESTSARPHS